MPNASNPLAANPIALRSLAPSYDQRQHGVYVDALARAIRDQDGVRNIALTGAYGTGKSSVLMRLTELDEFRDRVLELSLSTVGVMEERPVGDSDTNPAAWMTTNRIQKEIVKQILYRDTPEKTRGSRFRRLSRFRWLPEMGIAFGLGTLLFTILWITGLSRQIVGVLDDDHGVGWFTLVNIVLLVMLAGIVYSLRWLTHNRVFLEKLSAGPATVSLATTSSSYFDQYMDEIVYYFEQSGRDIVIFEDIDRFEDVYIFETLRALNTLLNGSDQVRRRRRVKQFKSANEESRMGKPRRAVPSPDVKFIYALRDSVFEKLGNEYDGEEPNEAAPVRVETARDAGDNEVRRANRTKFFDIVIPIVPFITHRNARDLMLDAMEGAGVSRDLINVAARFVADMRLITDMRNEYDVYADRLLGGPRQMPGLDPDKLFALIVYKCVHMADFEAIRSGASDLDVLHDVWRDIVKTALPAAQTRERAATRQLSLEGVLDGRAKSLGDRLESVMHALPFNQNHPTHVQLTVGNQAYKGAQLRTRELWTLLAADQVSAAVSNSYNGQSISFSFDQLQTLMGTQFDPSEWVKVDRRTQIDKRRSALRDVDFLRHHTWADIYARGEFTTTAEDGAEPETFAQATDRILKSRVARALVAAGYINGYFALYVSVYYGQHLRPRALNYIIHALDRGVADIHAELDGDDVEAIIGDEGTDIFRDRAAYNVSVLDHLLAKRPDEAQMIVRQVAAWDRDDRDFGLAYIQAGSERIRFVRRLAPLLPEKIASIVTDAPEDVLPHLIEAALGAAGSEIGEPPTSEFADLVIKNYRQFSSIITAPRGKAKVLIPKAKAIDAIAKLRIQLPSTAPLNSLARKRVIELGAYELNIANIENLTEQPSLALDAIRSASEPVYSAVLGRVGEYFALIAERNGAVTIEDPEEFLSILNDAHEVTMDRKHLAQLVEGASAACRVDAAADAPSSVWPTLAATRRMAPSPQNLLAYLDTIGELDDNVGQLLALVETVEGTDEVPDFERIRIAVAILNARETIPSARRRVNLAVSLHLPSPISADSLTPESGDIVGLMIETKLLSDDETTFAHAVIADWPTREAALIRSKNAPAIISPVLVPSTDLGSFFSSATVPTELKEAVLSQLGIFLPGASRDTVRTVSNFAATTDADVPFNTIDQLRISGATDHSIVTLLTNSQSISLDQIQATLRTLGAPYPSIADRGNVRPVVPDDYAHQRLLDRLKSAGIVSGHKPERGSRRVSLRKP
ncbi:hypothetical protein JOF28_001078 [Leucobacter exalbidus]|uniref:YobI-like P-loop NTPase domain-containing protein n=1 Tax=Leucobacter exalbidus TaxID=662960 RepID=A0A940T5C3_9MICO|nr:hypothetical protein [Leucobacter exalbidus]MBP1325846.1 hypothetical protein [Leucobacter exalbidus]